MPIRHRYTSPVADAGNPDEVGPNEWNDTHSFPWRIVTAGETLVASDPVAATITTAQTFAMPTTIVAGDVFGVRNNSTSTALASVDPGAGRQIQGCPVADTLTLAAGDQAILLARTTTFFELMSGGAVGPAGPAGSSGPITHTTTINFGAAPGKSALRTTVSNTSITANSKVEAWLFGSTATHNEEEHAFAPIRFGVSDRVAATSFVLHASSDFRLTGTFNVAYRITE